MDKILLKAEWCKKNGRVIIELGHGLKCISAIIQFRSLVFPGFSGYLNKSGLVAEPVVAVLAHAVEVRLVLPVVAVRELAVLVEPEDNQIGVFLYDDQNRIMANNCERSVSNCLALH